LADALEIPFYAVQAADRYQHYINDKVVGSRVGGRSFSPKVAASRLIMEILKEKALANGAQKIATGHFAKVVHNKSLNATNIFVSNDLENDQSYLLSSIDPDTLELLILPLSDMRNSEVKKIGDSLKLEYWRKPESDRVPLMYRPELARFVSERMPAKMIKEGNIIDFKNESILGDHDGIHHFGLGQKDLKTKTGTLIDKDYQVIGFRYAAGIVYTGYEEDLKYDTIILMHVKYAEGTDLSQPMEVYIKSREKGLKVQATLYPYNNRYAELKVKEMQPGLIFQGEYIAFYNKEAAMGRVIGGGEVRTCGYIDFDSLRTFPKKKEELDADEEREKVDIYSFKF
jgi:tRNA-specific 2-thiouridylase